MPVQWAGSTTTESERRCSFASHAGGCTATVDAGTSKDKEQLEEYVRQHSDQCTQADPYAFTTTCFQRLGGSSVLLASAISRADAWFRDNDVICCVSPPADLCLPDHRFSGVSELSGRNRRRNLAQIAHDIAASPDCLDVVLAARCVGEFLPQLADENIDDLHLRLVHAAIRWLKNISLLSVVPLRNANSSSIWYSLSVKCTRAPLISTILLSRLISAD